MPLHGRGSKGGLSGLETVYFHFRTKDKRYGGPFLALQFLSLPLPFLMGSDSWAINLGILSMKINFWNFYVTTGKMEIASTCC